MASEPAEPSVASLRFALDHMSEIPDPAAGVVRRTQDAPAVRAEAPAVPSPTRAERARRVALALVLAFVWLLAVVAATGVRPDLASPRVIAPFAVLIVAAGVGAGLLLARRDRGLPVSVRAAQHAVWVVPLVYALVAVGMATPEGQGPCATAHGGCMALSSLAALGAAAAAVVALRGTFFSAAAWRGAAVGALAGLSGSIGIHAHCPAQNLEHLLVAHGAPIVLFALLGGGLGRLGGLRLGDSRLGGAS